VKNNGVFELTNDEYLAVLPELRGLGKTWLGEADGAVVNDRRGLSTTVELCVTFDGRIVRHWWLV